LSVGLNVPLTLKPTSNYSVDILIIVSLKPDTLLIIEPASN
jgi:hypothetical protein